MATIKHKKVLKQYEVIVKDVAQRDYPDRWQSADQEIANYLGSQNPELIYVGLLVLKNIISKYEYEIDEGKDPVNRLVESIFPTLENLIVFLWENDSPESHSLLIEMLRIFYLTNQLQITKPFM